jgi:hypothetical protein
MKTERKFDGKEHESSYYLIMKARATLRMGEKWNSIHPHHHESEVNS